MVFGARPNLSKKEANILEEFSGEYGCTDKVYHRIDTSDSHPIR
jgi:hypothetical protein